MNNLLKIFLIFNLFSATTSQVNNFTLELPKAELAMGQNSSEIIKSDESIKVYGGMDVVGFTPYGGGCERHCTLSFPVSLNDDKGFLTSYLCGISSVFAKDIQVGHVEGAYNFKPEQGLEYAFVRIYDGFWSDTVSRNVSYEQCVQSGRGIVDVDKLIPVFPVPSQISHPNLTVCAYGGKSGLACGEIVESGITITVQVPGNCKKETTQFFNVTKVQMNKPYSSGDQFSPSDLGAPVYIPVQVPNSIKFIADPVGQVVENVEEPAEKNIWYYIPLDRILADSGLKIVELNTTGLSGVSASDDLAMKPNNSEIDVINDQHKQPQQPKQPRLMITHGGLPVVVSADDEHFVAETAKKCTLGFAIKKPRGVPRFDHGFLTLGSCLHGILAGTHGGIFMPYLTQTGEIEEINVGTASDLWYDLDIGLNYAIVRILPNDDENIFWEDRWSTILLTPGTVPGGTGAGKVIDPVTPLVGTRICAEGGYSGHICGEITSSSASLTIVNPWKWQRVVHDIIATYLDVSTFDEFQGLIKVRLDTRPRALSNRNDVEFDAGSPVYFPINGVTGIDTVLPVGILFKLTRENELDGDRCVPRFYMYCVSISRIFELNRFIELIKTPKMPT